MSYATLCITHPVAQSLADSLEMYVKGSMNAFAHKTNIEVNNQLNIYGMANLGWTMQTLCVMSALQHIRKLTYENYRKGKMTHLVFEEGQILFDNESAVKLIESYFSELRKFGLRIIFITQLPDRVLAHPRARNLFELTGIFVLLPNQQANADVLTELFRLSEAQASLISPQAQPGTGLIVVDALKIAFSNRIDKKRDALLYELWNTDPDKYMKERASE